MFCAGHSRSASPRLRAGAAARACRSTCSSTLSACRRRPTSSSSTLCTVQSCARTPRDAQTGAAARAHEGQLGQVLRAGHHERLRPPAHWRLGEPLRMQCPSAAAAPTIKRRVLACPPAHSTISFTSAGTGFTPAVACTLYPSRSSPSRALRGANTGFPHGFPPGRAGSHLRTTHRFARASLSTKLNFFSVSWSLRAQDAIRCSAAASALLTIANTAEGLRSAVQPCMHEASPRTQCSALPTSPQETSLSVAPCTAPHA